jgi:hypothetical protein
MKQMLLSAFVLLTVSACSHESAAPKCDEAEKQQLTVARDEATRQLTNAEEEFARYGGVLTLQNGDGYGSSLSRRDTALADVRQRLADLIVFSEKHPACFIAAERTEFIAAERAAADRAETAARERRIGGR